MDAMSDPDAMSGFGSLSIVCALDGTPVDSEPNWYGASRETLAEHGVPVCTWADHEDYAGVSARESAAIRRGRFGARAPVDDPPARANQRHPDLARAGTHACRRCAHSSDSRPPRPCRPRTGRPAGVHGARACG